MSTSVIKAEKAASSLVKGSGGKSNPLRRIEAELYMGVKTPRGNATV